MVHVTFHVVPIQQRIHNYVKHPQTVKKHSILDICLGSEYASAFCIIIRFLVTFIYSGQIRLLSCRRWKIYIW